MKIALLFVEMRIDVRKEVRESCKTNFLRGGVCNGRREGEKESKEKGEGTR
jgi:hypothetical protein